jgi:hypothetical protein
MAGCPGIDEQRRADDGKGRKGEYEVEVHVSPIDKHALNVRPRDSTLV